VSIKHNNFKLYLSKKKTGLKLDFIEVRNPDLYTKSSFESEFEFEIWISNRIEKKNPVKQP
jgi:hypothetical protein